jgi:hypothetical protein
MAVAPAGTAGVQCVWCPLAPSRAGGQWEGGSDLPKITPVGPGPGAGRGHQNAGLGLRGMPPSAAVRAVLGGLWFVSDAFC